MNDLLIRGIGKDTPYRVVVARTTDLVREAIGLHGLDGGAADALARALTALTLTGVMDKDWYRISAQWMGRGSFGTVHVDVRPPGDVRGYLNGAASVATVEEGLGRGILSVLRQKEGGQYTTGQAALTESSVDGDLEAWIRQSDQLGTALRVFVRRGDDGALEGVAGVMVQELPGADDAALDDVVAPALRDRSLVVSDSLEELAAAAAPGVGEVEWFGEVPLRWQCVCSAARVQDGVKLLGAAELDDMIAKGEEPEVRCDFCTKTYVVSTEALTRIRASLDGV